MKQFKNEWSRLHDAMVANIKGKEELLEKLAADNVEMLEALKGLLFNIDGGWPIDSDVINPARAVISKAERKGE